MDTYSRLDAEERHARRLQDTEQSLQRSTNLLADAQRTVAETEEIGLGTVESLHGQRQHQQGELVAPLLRAGLGQRLQQRIVQQHNAELEEHAMDRPPETVLVGTGIHHVPA